MLSNLIERQVLQQLQEHSPAGQSRSLPTLTSSPVWTQ